MGTVGSAGAGWGGPRGPGGRGPAGGSGWREKAQPNCWGPTPDRLQPPSYFFPLLEGRHASCAADEPAKGRGGAAAARESAGTLSRERRARGAGAAGLRARVARLRETRSSLHAPRLRLSEATVSADPWLEPKASRTSFPRLRFRGSDRKAGEPPNIIPPRPAL